MSKLFICFFFSLIFSLCNLHGQKIDRLDKVALRDADNRQKKIFNDSKAEFVVLAYFNHECPICKFYTAKMIQIDSICKNLGVDLFLVFAGQYNKSEVANFMKDYNIPTKYYFDTKYKLAKLLNATITPEIILVSRTEKKILYSGLIDDQFESLGVKRNRVENEYFLRALYSAASQRSFVVKQTNALGCGLNYDID